MAMVQNRPANVDNATMTALVTAARLARFANSSTRCSI
jgi:hypothetical protein